MAYNSLVILAAAFCLFIIQHNIETWSRNRRLRRLSAQNGCGAMPIMKSRWPWGIDRIVKILSFKGDLLDEKMHAGFLRNRRWTHAVDGVLTRPTIMTADPRNIQSMLATNFKDWGVGERRSKQFGPFLGLGVFTSDGAFWEHARAVVRPQFQREQISNLEATLHHLDQFMRMDVKDDGWTTFTDLLPHIYRFTLDTGTDLLFGQSVNSQTAARCGQGESSFETAFDEASNNVAIRMRMGSFYWLINNRKFRAACRKCDEYATGFVRKALHWRAEGKPINVKTKAEKGVFLRGLADSTQDPKEIRDQLLQLLFAGRDTTASTISFALLCLARNPAAWGRLRAEVIDAFGADETSTAGITFASLKSCSFLQSVLQETLRMFPPIAMNTREALRDTILPTGGGSDYTQPIAVARGTIVNFSCYVVQRRTDLWGADAAVWNPDRWSGRKFGFDYIPFNAGPRHCPGQQFALTEVGLVLVRMAQRFDAIECRKPEEKIQKKLGLTIFPKKGVVLRFHRSAGT